MKILFYIFISSFILSCQSLKFAKKETQGERTPQSQVGLAYRGASELIEQIKQGRKSLQKVNLIGGNLSGANLREADLRRADLKYADLTATDLEGGNLAFANLYKAILLRADLEAAILIGADLRGAKMAGANLREADLRGAKFKGTNLSFAYIDSKYRDMIMKSGALNTDKINWVD